MQICTDRAKRDHYFKKTPFLQCFSAAMQEAAVLYRFAAGEYIIRNGTLPENLYFLLEGEVIFFAAAESGKKVPLGGTRRFSIFGEASALWRMKPMSDVQAISNCYCFGIPLRTYRSKLLQDLTFMQYVSRTLAARLAFQNDNIVSALAGTYDKKVAAFFIQNSQNNQLIPTLKQSAGQIGISYRHLLRILKKFMAKGLLCKNKRSYIILDYKQLYKAASDTYAYFD